MRPAAPMLLLAAGLLLAGCHAPAPRPIAYGVDACARCHMAIADPRFAAELVTTAGRVELFDDIGCLVAYVRAETVPSDRIHSLWVHPVGEPGQWLDARRASYVERPAGGTPMASGTLAFRTLAAADSARRAGGGSIAAWPDLLAHPAGPGEVPG
jgi:copper chaperone NosL